MPRVPDTPPDNVAHDADIQFGSPTPIKSKLNHGHYHKSSPLKNQLYQARPDKPVPIRGAYGPIDTTHIKITQIAPSPSSYPRVDITQSTNDHKQTWKKDGLALPKFKKKPNVPQNPEATRIRVPQEGERPYEIIKQPPAMYDLTSRTPVQRFTKPEEVSTYMSPAKATEHLKALLDEGFQQSEDEDIVGSDIVEGLKCRLLSHQVKGLQFLTSRESKTSRGGLLADEMGLGKTVQSMALILKHPRPDDVECIKSTLVVTPLSLLEQWSLEIKTKTRMSVYIHHGPSRTKNHNEFKRYDVVLTTYNTLTSEYSPSKDVLGSGIFGVEWWRIILDEAHTIKNRLAKMSIAACQVNAINRWALTGTPVQNTVDEVHSLLKFLRIEPLSDLSTFKEKITLPIQRGRTSIAMKRLSAILSQIMLRRTKSILESSFKLPPKSIQHIQVDFSSEEREFYRNLEQRADSALAMMKKSGEMGYISVLVLLQRLRQACNHTQLVTKDLDPSDYRVELSPSKEVDELADLLAGFKSSEIVDIGGTANLGLSAKMDELLKIIRREQRKMIVFSQWTSMLDLVAPFLDAHKVGYCKYYGSMPNKDREGSIKKLKSDEACEIMLCSLKAGALGLNLTTASRVVLLDVWWNPAIEDQAISRVHRIGQESEVVIYKLTVRDTVEDRILRLQDQKREIAKSVLGEGQGAMKLGLNELLALFRHDAEYV